MANTQTAGASSIPLIDLAPFLAPTDAQSKDQTAKAILSAFKSYGFVYLTNHPIPPHLVASVFDHSSQFFTLPQGDKNKLAWYDPRANRGYTGHGKEKVAYKEVDKEAVEAMRESVPDLKESLEIGNDADRQWPNMWPENGMEPQIEQSGTADGEESQRWAQSFKATMLRFWDECKDFHMVVMRAIALGLNLDEHYFDSYVDGGDNTLRLLHYPPVDKSVFEKNKMQVRAGEHTDYGSITLLFQDSRGGLQVESPDGQFVHAPPIPDSIVVNAGDLLARWSSDVIKSTKHRVVEPPQAGSSTRYPARYSVAYFCNPNFDRTITAIPGTNPDDIKEKYEPIKSGDYLVQRLTATYSGY